MSKIFFCIRLAIYLAAIPLFLFIDSFRVFAAQTAQAPTQMKYTMLESLPGFFQAGATMIDLPDLILALYKFGIWTVGIAGMFMIVIGGISYMMSAGNKSSAGSAKGIINDAILGVVTALCAYLALYVINPDFTRISLNFVPVTVQEENILPSEFVPLPGQLSDAEAKRRLNAAGINVKNNLCARVTDSGCTSLEGIPAKAISGLIAMKKSCPSCSFFVTGGTEGGHKSHGPGNPMLDVRYAEDVHSFLAKVKASKGYAQYGISQVCTSPTDLKDVSYGRSYDQQCKDPSTDAHFHFAFGL